jgi:hypothetical protein
MVALPADTPVTRPPLLLTVAIAVLLLLQMPPDVASASAVVDPTHTVDAYLMAATTGTGLGDAKPLPAALVQPPTVCVTVYVAGADTVIDEVVAPVFHNRVPV